MFNVKHLISYHGDSSNDNADGNLSLNFLHLEENDAVQKELKCFKVVGLA